MNKDKNRPFDALFDPETLSRMFPPERADQFFDALLGDADEGAYDIRLAYKGMQENRLTFDIELHQRPGKCLVCSLTYGLPTVFSRHPVIDIQGVVDQIALHMEGNGRCAGWTLGRTREVSRQLHVVPLEIDLENESGR